MGSEMTKGNIQTELHHFESLKPHTHKAKRLTGILHSRMHRCTHTHIHTRTDDSVVCVQLGSFRFSIYFRRENTLTEPFLKVILFVASMRLFISIH